MVKVVLVLVVLVGRRRGRMALVVMVHLVMVGGRW